MALAREYLQFRDYQCSGKVVHGGEMYSRHIPSISELNFCPFHGRCSYKNASKTTNINYHLTLGWYTLVKFPQKTTVPNWKYKTPLLGTAGPFPWGNQGVVDGAS